MVARSSVEAKFQAMARGICEILWLKILLRYDCKEHMRLYCDHETEINISHSPVQPDQT